VSSWAGRRVLVTGAGGFIGSHLAERLVEEGAKVRAFTHYNALGSAGWLDRSPRRADLEIAAGDITDAESVKGAVRDREVIFHLAALIGIPYSYEHPQEVIDTNIVGTSNVLLAAKELGSLERIVLTSTSEVYGSALRIPMDEEHPLQAQSPYSATKIAADALGLSFHRSFGLPVTIVRPFNAYGPRQSARAVIPTILSQALAGLTLRLGTLDTTRDFTYVADTARGFAAVGASDEALGEVINVGSGTEVSIRDVVRTAGEIVGRELTVEGDEQRLRPAASEVSRLHSDSTKALKLAGWRAEVSLEDGLRHTAAWIREHLELYRPREYAV
jgi:dTDP-glucose 4,6-dehydratase